MDSVNQIIREARSRGLRHESTVAARISVAPPPPPPGRLEGREEIDDDLVEEHEELACFRCPVHLTDYNADDHQPHVMIPCGHTACRETCLRETRCPICRVVFRQHTMNRSLMSVLEIMSRPSPELKPPNEHNKFIAVLRSSKRVINDMTSPASDWSFKQWEIFHLLIEALKFHALHATRVWIDASGVSPVLARELRTHLVTIKKTMYNRRRLGWEKLDGLPMHV